MNGGNGMRNDGDGGGRPRPGRRRTAGAAAGLAGLAVLLAMLTQCSRVQVLNTLTAPKSNLSWPEGGAARVRFVASIRSPDDLFVRQNWLGLGELFAGKADRSFSVPFDVHMDGEERLLVTDPGKSCVHLIDQRRQLYLELSRVGDGALEQPIGVTTDGEGRIYVSDSKLRDVFVFDHEGRFVRPLAAAGTFQRPAGLAFCAKTGLLYVADVTAHEVKAFRPDGTPVRAFGGRGAEPGKLNYPTHVCVDREGIVYVTSSLNFAICLFGPAGEFLYTFGKEGDTPGYFSRPKGVATDRAGRIYVVDAIFDAFQIFDNRGALLLTVGQGGGDDGEFWLPAGICIDARRRIFVADQQNHRIEVFQCVEEAAP